MRHESRYRDDVERRQHARGAEEMEFIKATSVPVLFWQPPPTDTSQLTERVIESLSPHVYVSVDLDVFDPSIMAAVGNPEPGGMTWNEVTGLLRVVGEQREIVGFDLVELVEQPRDCRLADVLELDPGPVGRPRVAVVHQLRDQRVDLLA